ncbi:MAG TPA: hypothetical protein VF803_02935 [Candidatus Paceibacterota bacterium]
MKYEMKMALLSGCTASLVVGLLALQHSSPQMASAQYLSTPVPFERLGSGPEEGLSDQVNYVITSPEELKTLWKMIGATTTPPVVDFSTHQVLAVFSGPGAQASVANVNDLQGERVVSVAVAKPDATCAGKPVLPNYELVAVAATSLSLSHKYIEMPVSCAH